MRKLSKQNLDDLVMGCCYLGSGGGGSYEAGLKRIHDDLAAGLTFNLISVNEMRDDDYAATTYYVGSTAPYTQEQLDRFNKLARIKEEATTVALRLLQKYTGKNFVAVIAGEIGAGNTPYALSAAAHMGIAQLDADTAGRAVPEIDQSTIFAAGISLLPAAGATLFGDELLITKVATPSREEEFLRIASTISMHIAAADSALPGKVLKQPNIVVQDSLTLCERIGKAYRVRSNRKKIQSRRWSPPATVIRFLPARSLITTGLTRAAISSAMLKSPEPAIMPARSIDWLSRTRTSFPGGMAKYPSLRPISLRWSIMLPAELSSIRISRSSRK